jgi:hypothetical protein
MLMTLPDSTFEKLNDEYRGALTSNSQRLSDYASKKAAMGAGKYLYQPFNVIGWVKRGINAGRF